MRLLPRTRTLLSLLIVTSSLVGPSGCAVLKPAAKSQAPIRGEWRSYGGTLANAKYSPLDQVSAVNVQQLRIAWRWKSPDHEIMDKNPRVETFVNEGTPIMVDGVLYVSTALTSPPLVVGDVVIVGSSIMDWPARQDMPPGDVRGFDVRTGRHLWTFHTIPRDGQVGIETWENESWKTIGSANVWSIMSADEELGYAYLPVSTPANDYYGGHRHGDNLFAESLVCIEARTGKRVWHFQLVHHGLWDYDLPAAPNLVDITVNGQRIKAVAQVTKQGFVFVFDRITGRPVWPIEERPVAPSRVPGEKASPTQPFPTRPPPFDRQGLTADDVIDFTPELRQQALTILEAYDHGPLFTPPSERGTVTVPGPGGGANWAGAAFDPEQGWLYVPSLTLPAVLTVFVPPIVASPDRYAGRFRFLSGPGGLPLTKPPYGRITAIDLNTGDHRWMVPHGEGPRANPLLEALHLPRLGWNRFGFVLATRTLLFAGQTGRLTGIRPAKDRPDARIFTFATDEAKLRAFNKTTGELLAEIDLPANMRGSPMTYLAGGKQFIVIPVGGANIPAELVALTLP